MDLLIAVTSLILLVVGFRPWRRESVLRWLVRGLATALALVGFGVVAHGLWLEHMPQPAPVEPVELFEGVTYRRIVRGTPRRVVIHVVTVDLDRPGVELFVTPPDWEGERSLAARTTSAFLEEHHLQVAINGGFFEPWYSEGPHFHPHVGDPVDVHGLGASRGRVYSEAEPAYRTLHAARDNRISIGAPLEPIWNAISGREVFLRDGELNRDFSNLSHALEPSPRSIYALDATGRRLLLFAVDGRQPGASEGATLYEMAQIVREQGGVTALHMDGGGSTSLVAQGADGRPRLLSCPIHTRIPCRERPVANHLGIRASRLESGLGGR